MRLVYTWLNNKVESISLVCCLSSIGSSILLPFKAPDFSSIGSFILVPLRAPDFSSLARAGIWFQTSFSYMDSLVVLVPWTER